MSNLTSNTPKVDATPTEVKAKVEVKSEEAKTSTVIKDMTEAEILADASIEARPLMMPQQLHVKPKRAEYAFYWVNRKGDQGTRYERFRAAGFENATPADVEGLDESVMIQAGSIILGDLILLKCNKIKYYGFLKNNIKKANDSVASRSNPKSAAQSFISDVGADSQYLKGKVSFFQPNASDFVSS